MKQKKFEHRTVELGQILPYPNIYSPERTSQTLDISGEEGWELVSVIAIGPHASHGLAFFKREKK
jgi:hypothetical protein